MTLTCSRAALEARKSKEQCFQISKEKKMIPNLQFYTQPNRHSSVRGK